MCGIVGAISERNIEKVLHKVWRGTDQIELDRRLSVRFVGQARGAAELRSASVADMGDLFQIVGKEDRFDHLHRHPPSAMRTGDEEARKLRLGRGASVLPG